jgi:hypothetical protein
VIRCEHCGSTLPDGAIFCGECGRAVTTSAARRTAPVEPADRATPPPLQQPDAHGRPADPAADAWLPESTLDPATRAWLTGADRGDGRTSSGPDTASEQSSGQDDRDQRRDDRSDLSPRSAPTHVHGSGSGLGDWTGQSPSPSPSSSQSPSSAVEGHAAPDVPAEPTLDPDAFPADPVRPQDDPEVQRTDAWDAETAADQDRSTSDAGASAGAAPVWAPPSTPAAPPTGPSWWIGRAPSADATSTSAAREDGDDQTPGTSGTGDDQAPRPGDTAVFRPLVERRTPRPMPLVAPGSPSANCHVCGHALEPDDIFCEECGSVRPAVTAAFTGPVMPLPLTRPDWAADEEALRSAVSDAHDLTDDADGLSGGADGSTGGQDAPSTASDGVPGSADRPLDESDALSAEPDGPPSDPDALHDGPDALPAAERGDVDSGEDHDPAPDHAGADGTSTGTPRDVPSSGAVPGPVAVEAGTPTAAPLPPVDGSPAAAPLPPTDESSTAAHSSGPGGSTTTPGGAEDPNVDPGEPAPVDDGPETDEDVEETRIVSRAPEREPFLLHFSTGERLGVHGSALLGRLPRPDVDEHFDGLLTIRDPGKSVSKTHLELGRDGDDLWVSDRYSGNGTMIRHIDGSIRRCEPGRRYRVERGARVDIGEQFFLVQ